MLNGFAVGHWKSLVDHGGNLWLIETQWFHYGSLGITGVSFGIISVSLRLNGFIVGHRESLVGHWG